MDVADLQGRFFLDTNILVYSFDDVDVAKQQIAQALIEHALTSRRGMVSTQVVQEFLNVALRRFSPSMTVQEAKTYLQRVLLPLCMHFPNSASYERALQLHLETGFAWYDALIVGAAVDSACTTLLSEDLQAGRNVRGTIIVNPFAS
jgi:predicted nucleic acid-binding protein